MKTVTLPGGEAVPALGQGTWKMGDSRAQRKEEIAALQLGMDLGMRLIDTAQMYGEGAAESLIAEAIAGRREEVFLVSKFYPHDATAHGMAAACERSLRRLQTDRIDLYLLHWRGDVPLEETLRGFMALRAAGKIRYFGVSNFDAADMAELWALAGGEAVATNQVLYNLARRGIEWDLAPWCAQRDVPLMAYSPIEQARLLSNAKLKRFANERALTPAQVALAWLLAKEQLMVIPKTSHVARVRENFGALDCGLDEEALRQLDAIFPPPRGPQPLAML